MKVIEDKITIKELEAMASNMFGNLVKAVVDIEKELIVVDAELHSDQESFLLSQGSKQENLWGINIYPKLEEDRRIEFDSMINLRPTQNNYSRSVEDFDIQKKIVHIVNSKITS